MCPTFVSRKKKICKKKENTSISRAYSSLPAGGEVPSWVAPWLRSQASSVFAELMLPFLGQDSVDGARGQGVAECRAQGTLASALRRHFLSF